MQDRRLMWTSELLPSVQFAQILLKFRIGSFRYLGTLMTTETSRRPGLVLMRREMPTARMNSKHLLEFYLVTGRPNIPHKVDSIHKSNPN
jgi:hypothetical protein